MPRGKQDPELKRFSIAHDKAYVLPALRQALALNPQLQFIATPWTAPAWMKGNHSLSNSHNRGTLRAAAYGPWAAYIIKFIQAYTQAGIPINGFAPANEPGNPTPYPGMNFNPTAESHWITQWLVPALVKAHLHPQLYGTELGWNSGWYAQELLATPSSHDLSGISWHCYYGSPNVMTAIHDSAPQFGTIVDECSPGISAIPIPEVLISSLRNWASSVALWNIALDQSLGPVEQPNKGCTGCYGLFAISDETHTVAPLSDLFELGQASEFVEPGAYVIAANNFVAYNYARPGVNFINSGLDDVAFVNPDGSRVLIAYNNAPTAIPFAVSWNGQYFQYTIPPGATTTFEWSSTA
jgi:glucosylceramidase